MSVILLVAVFGLLGVLAFDIGAAGGVGDAALPGLRGAAYAD